ncbi:DUF3857 domain-containing transglutaminase family protein [Chitinophaga sancti]|uniref:DUF3857 and transglutaminase domain-containing protein n=1 Tax=Chitinophaga sancti TaxID=1004 RepID=A0A1K1ND23_9BACT|nr:DUF3857 and transglutaminase domain-containing protein [Chitinophaga sancti]WQD63322.1 DUF3857 and transglutaminase domain-containing protein [Chitinophaga sancti]WQG91052.1 DUF3857 and transglutaminase domain-containing protein [Chitinophaga sancti]SFW33220.1 Transglutaminase-like enzyme, putative cysteine protease [Chitinophaga sancti]
MFYKSFGLALLLFGHLMPSQAKDPEYPAITIPANLKEKAHAVKRLEELSVKLVNPGEVRVTRHYVITVLDAKGDKYASIHEYYNKLRDVRTIKGRLIDQLGFEVSKMKQSDVSDVSGVGDQALMSDTRYKLYSFNYKVYPYTVDIETEVRYNHAFYLPDWMPQEDENYAVEQSKLVVTVPADYTLRYKAFRYTGEPVQATEKDSHTYTWEVKGMTAMPEEDYVAEDYDRTTTVMLAPSSFEMQDYKGTMNSWEEMGHFIYTLNQGRDLLPDNIKKTVHELTDGKSEKEKIEILYRYLQQHTRYILITLGIGGLQTFDANSVATKGYGDCKALSNYMVALLKEAGVQANYVLVQAGDTNTQLVEDFPSTQFNHMIACVPGKKDTTWLECTSNTLPVGYLSSFTAGRPVLVVADKGSALVRTPTYGMDQNQRLRRIAATVSETGDMQVKINTHSTALQQDYAQEMIHSLSHDKILEKLRNDHLLPSYDVNKYEAKEINGAVPAVDEEMEINAHSYATVSGKRMFLEPNLLSKVSSKLESAEVRMSPVNIYSPFIKVDTVVITIPAGYTPESVPQPVTVKSNFGEYTSGITVKDNQIVFTRRYCNKAGIFPASEWVNFAAFNNAVYKADRARVVLVKQ